MSPSELRIGVVGFRRGRHLAELAGAIPGVTIAAVCDLNPEVQQAARELFPGTACSGAYEDLFQAGLDALLVAVPPRQHADYAIRALDRGLHVLCEVPAFHRREEMAPLCEAVRRSRAVYMLAENLNYWPFVHDVKACIATGEIGRVVYAEAEYLHDCTENRPQGDWILGYPPIQYCTHSLGPILEWVGEPLVSVTARHTGTLIRPELATISFESALFRTASGVVVKVLCAFNLKREPPFHRFVVYGTNGYFEKTAPMEGGSEFFLYTDRAGKPGRPVKVPFSETWPADQEDPAAAPHHGGADLRMLREFVAAVREGKPSPIGIEKAVRITMPGLCAHESALAGGVPVPIPDAPAAADESPAALR